VKDPKGGDRRRLAADFSDEEYEEWLCSKIKMHFMQNPVGNMLAAEAE